MDSPAATRPEAAPGPSEVSARRWSPDWLTVASLAVVAVVVALPLRALFQQSGSPMEEGFMLVFPERVLAGDVPHRDFLHLYGPGSLWVLAGVYQLVGTSLAAERAVGLIQQLGIILGVFAVARPFGRAIASVCAAMSAVLTLTAIGLVALAWNGGVALAVLGLVAGLQGRRRLEPSAARRREDAVAGRWFALAGVLGAGALLYRPDLVVAVALSYTAMAWRLPRAHLVKVVGALIAVLVAGYGFLLLAAGPATGVRGLFLEPVFELRGGRRLPAPPSWDHYDGALAAVGQLVAPGWSLPSLTGPQQIVVWFFLLPVVAVVEVAYGAWRVRSDRSSGRARCLLAAGLLGLGMLPQALQRPDATHLAWVSCVPLALLPLFVAEAVAGRRWARRPVLPAVLGALVALVVLVAVIPHPTVRTWTDLTRQSGRGTDGSFEIVRGDRNFYIGAEGISQAAQGVVDELDRRAQPGDRLFVGPADLRLTPYSDAFFYHLFPELPPATRYIEMDPGVANAEGSGLAEDVASADWLILSHVWDPWDEPNDSRQPGSDAPNGVVARSFCVVDAFGDEGAPSYLLYQRCR